MKNWHYFLSKRGIQADRVIGVDEAGRGPLAGPVVVAGVVLPRQHGIEGLDDSKVLSEERREALFDQIMALASSTSSERCAEVFVEKASNVVIDRDGILVVTKRLMMRVVKRAQVEWALLDAVNINLRDVCQLAITKGDARVDCIAAASIIAKVTRDRMMMQMDQKYPGYGLAQHKGYGTEQHRLAIKALGVSKVHRRSFLAE